MNHELDDIEKKSEIRYDKLKKYYSDPALWVVLILGISFQFIGTYLLKHYHEGDLRNLLGFFLLYFALLSYLGFINPLFIAVIAPMLIKNCIDLAKMFAHMIK